MEYSKVCKECGSSFTATAPATRYCCAACKQAAAKRNRQTWEQETGYRNNQRARMKARRKEGSAEPPRGLPACFAARSNAGEPAPPLSDIAKAAAAGGNLTAEYWDTYKAKALEHGATHLLVNGSISISEPNFGELVEINLLEEREIHITQ